MPATLCERFLLVGGLAFPRTQTTGDEYIEDLVVSSVVRSFDARRFAAQ